MAQELSRKPAHEARESSIGLGFRVPMVIASPWTRGGNVCSEVFDHTSVLQFLEKLLSHKTGKQVQETNISPWRRAVCGDLTSAFQTKRSDSAAAPPFSTRDEFVQEIHQASFKQLPSDFKQLTSEDISKVRSSPSTSNLLPRQEKGIRPSCALPYQLYAEASLSADTSRLDLRLEARSDAFGARSAGSPFNVYIFNKAGEFKIRSYAVEAGRGLSDSWLMADFDEGQYHLQVHGPNGFFREFKGEAWAESEVMVVGLEYSRVKGKLGVLSGGIDLKLANRHSKISHSVEIHDNAYHRSDGVTCYSGRRYGHDPFGDRSKFRLVRHFDHMCRQSSNAAPLRRSRRDRKMEPYRPCYG